MNEQIITIIIYPIRNQLSQKKFMDDNNRPHRGRQVRDAHEAGHIIRLNCS